MQSDGLMRANRLGNHRDAPEPQWVWGNTPRATKVGLR